MALITGESGTQTVADVINDVRQRLHGSSTGAVLNILNGALSASATSVTLTDALNGVKSGALLEIDTELMYVRSVSGLVCTVIRGHAGTTATSHSDGAIVRINPSYHARDIFRAVQDEFTSLNGTGLVQFHEVEIEYDGNARLYDSGLPTTVDHLYVQQAHYEADNTYKRWRPLRVDLLKGMNTDDFASGSAYVLQEIPSPISLTRIPSSTCTVRVVAATSFGRPTSTASSVLEGSLGTGFSVVPIVAVGAAWRLILGKEAQRLNPDWASGSRRAEEVAPGSLSFLGRALEGQRHELIEHALERQIQKYPPRTNV